MQPVTLINAFEGPAGKEEQFLKMWQEAAEYMRHAPGFRSTRRHESLDPQAQFQFVNIVQWESPEHFQAAINSEAFQQISRKMSLVIAHPTLYRVISE